MVPVSLERTDTNAISERPERKAAQGQKTLPNDPDHLRATGPARVQLTRYVQCVTYKCPAPSLQALD